MRLTLALACAALLGACTFEGGGIVPFEPSPASVAEEDLEVPYVQTPRPVVAAMLALAAVGSDDYLIDLGSGDGRIAIMAAQRGARALGVDIDPDRIAEANRGAGVAGVETRARFRRQDLFDTPLREASVVTMYLLPAINLRLRPRLLTELRPGTRIVSHNFTLGEWAPDETREIGASHIFLWVVPAVVEGRWAIEDASGANGMLEFEQLFQTVSGTLAGRPLRDIALRGRQLSFTVDLPGGARTFHGLVEDREIVPDPAAPPGSPVDWRARRVD
jgi:SAM-dependent methyltransferase